jgi:hypothetical protein
MHAYCQFWARAKDLENIPAAGDEFRRFARLIWV